MKSIKVIDNEGTIYDMEYSRFVEKEDIKDSYIVWYIHLKGRYEGISIEHIQYVYYENLEQSLCEGNFKILD